MRVYHYIQASLLLLVGTILAVKGPSKYQSIELLWAQESGDGYYYYNRPGYYRHYYYPYIRNYNRPRVYYKVETTIAIEQSPNEKISNVYIDSERIDKPYRVNSQKKGYYHYYLSTGIHKITWKVTDKTGSSKIYKRTFQISPQARSVHILIDGEEFTQK